MEELQEIILNVYCMGQFVNELNQGSVDGFVDDEELLNALAGKSDKATTYTRSDVDTKLNDYATTSALNTGLNTKQPTGDYATNTSLTNGLATKQPTGDYA